MQIETSSSENSEEDEASKEHIFLARSSRSLFSFKRAKVEMDFKGIKSGEREQVFEKKDSLGIRQEIKWV